MQKKYNSADRKKEYDIFYKNFCSRKNIDIYGFPGVGKTYLFEFFARRYIDKNFVDKIKLMVSLKKDGNKIIFVKIGKRNCDLISILQIIFDSIDLIHIDIDKVRADEVNLECLIFKKKISEEKAAIHRLSFIFSYLLKNVFIVFDNIHLVKDEAWNAFVEEVVRCKYEEEIGFRIITIGSRRKSCTFFRLRDQTVPCKLENFTEENTREMVRGLAARHKFDIEKEKLVFETIFRLTIGHPESICIAVKHWTNNHSQPLDGDDIQSRYGEGITALLNEFIQVKILPPLSSALQEEEHYPSGETPLTLLQHLAPLRLLPSRMLRQVLPVMFPDFYQIKKSTFSDDIFRIFYDNLLLEKKEIESIYEMQSIIRNVLIEDLKVNDRLKFNEINEKILSVYNKLIEDDIVRRYEYLTEKIYHIVLPATDVQERENSVCAAINEHIKMYDNTDIKKLQNMLQHDDWLSDKMNWKDLFNSLQL